MSKILFLVSSMQGGGAERVASLLCNEWVKNGHSVTLMPTFSGKGICLYPLDEKVKLIFLADLVGTVKRSLLNKFRRVLTLRGFIKRYSPDVIVSFLPDVNIAAVVANVGLGHRVIVSERTYPPARPLGLVLEVVRRWAYGQAAGVVMQTNQGRDWLYEYCPRATCYVIPNPVTYPLPCAQPVLSPSEVVNPGKKLVLGVGRLSEEKGFMSLLASYSMLADRNKDWDLVLLGEGAERSALECRIKESGLENRVHMPGRVGNLAEWYGRADLYVMSSYREGFPNSLLEAMACGLPVVSFDCKTGPREIISPDENGMLVKSSSISELSEAMHALMRNDGLREKLGRSAICVRDRFSMQNIAADWAAVLQLN